MEKKKKASEFFNKEKKSSFSFTVNVNTQFWQFSLLLYIAFICTALLLPRPVSDWKIKVSRLPRPYNPWEQKPSLPLFSTGVPSLALTGRPRGLPREQPPRGGLTRVGAHAGREGARGGGSRGWRVSTKHLTLCLVGPQTWLCTARLWKKCHVRRCKWNTIPSQSDALAFSQLYRHFCEKPRPKVRSCTQPPALTLETKTAKKSRKNRKLLCVPIRGPRRGGRRGVSPLYFFSVPHLVPAPGTPWGHLAGSRAAGREARIPNRGFPGRVLRITHPPPPRLSPFSLFCFGGPRQIVWLPEVTPELVNCHRKPRSGFKTWWENVVPI